METTKTEEKKNAETPVVQQEKKNLLPWQNALVMAEKKFLAISGKESETKIELGFAVMLMEKNPILKDCTYDSIVNSVINVARTGITLNPVLKLAHLVPRKNKGQWECSLDFDYKGLVKILKDNGCVKDVQAIIVYEDEAFEESNSPIIAPIHKKAYAKTEEDQKKRTFAGVYSQVLLPDNTVVYTPFMPYWAILKREKVSQSANSEFSPWKKWREEMVKKTKLRYDFNTLISGSPNDKVLATVENEEKNSIIDITAQFIDEKEEAKTNSTNKAAQLENKLDSKKDGE